MVFSRFENRDPNFDDNKITLLNSLVLNLKTQLREVTENARVAKEEFVKEIELEKKNCYQAFLKADEFEKEFINACKINEELTKNLAVNRQECDELRKEAHEWDDVLTLMKDTIEQQQKEIQQWKITGDILQGRSTELERLKIEHQNTKNDLDVKTSQLQKVEREVAILKMAKFEKTTQMNSYMPLLKSNDECDVLLWYFIENNLLSLKEEGINKYTTVTGSSNAKWIGIIEKCKNIPDYDETVFGKDILKFIICYKDQRMGFFDLIESFIKLETKNMQRVVSDSVKLDSQFLNVNAAKMTKLLNDLQRKIKNGIVPSNIDVSFRREVDELRQRATVS